MYFMASRCTITYAACLLTAISKNDDDDKDVKITVHNLINND